MPYYNTTLLYETYQCTTFTSHYFAILCLCNTQLCHTDTWRNQTALRITSTLLHNTLQYHCTTVQDITRLHCTLQIHCILLLHKTIPYSTIPNITLPLPYSTTPDHTLLCLYQTTPHKTLPQQLQHITTLGSTMHNKYMTLPDYTQQLPNDILLCAYSISLNNRIMLYYITILCDTVLHTTKTKHGSTVLYHNKTVLDRTIQ